jgi:8-oxo-dGTP diphosphatase
MSARPELCVGVVAVRSGSLLLVQRGREPGAGLWSLPGGRVEAGERMTDAVLRELAEETGLAGRCGPLVGWVERIGDDPHPYHYAIFDFAVTVECGAEPVAGDDAAAARFVPLGEVLSADLVLGLAEFLVEHGVVEPPA